MNVKEEANEGKRCREKEREREKARKKDRKKKETEKERYEGGRERMEKMEERLRKSRLSYRKYPERERECHSGDPFKKRFLSANRHFISSSSSLYFFPPSLSLFSVSLSPFFLQRINGKGKIVEEKRERITAGRRARGAQKSIFKDSLFLFLCVALSIFSLLREFLSHFLGIPFPQSKEKMWCDAVAAATSEVGSTSFSLFKQGDEPF